MERPDASPGRIYRRLLRLYPAGFRARYADEMVQLFEDQVRDARQGRAPAGPPGRGSERSGTWP